ncbi:MAG: hypothetical protein OHM56_12290 [Spiroplasma phoeniceum]|nr:MAG: hypothetical protein OHM57_11725 [Spiroplasma phoeniceum]UZQ32290.1 MAG: hypothetical protein OHM56_12290 [Spiroplasma phoeniceum]
MPSKTVDRPYNYSLDNYALPWEEEYKHISKKTFYPTLLFLLKERLQTDNSINIACPTVNDFSKIDYNEYIKMIVPFDNDTIYFDNNVWKAKQGGEIPSDVIKDSDLNKDYIDKENGKYILKKSKKLDLSISGFNSAIENMNRIINTKQDKLISGTNIKTINGNSLLVSGDISINADNGWEIVDTSDFIVGQTGYNIPNFDKENYIYRIWASGKYSKVDLKSKWVFQKGQIFIQTIGVIYGQIVVNSACLALSINPDGLINIGVNGPATFKPLGFVFIERKKVS